MGEASKAMREDRDEPSRQGQIVLERYEIGRLVAAGGMGSVYEATHVGLGRRVAVKFLRPELADDARTLARFEQEAVAAGALEHENIGSIIDFGQAANGDPCLVMEYLEGNNLARLLEDEGPLPVPRAVDIARQICRGLEVAHRHGVIHRDLKPKNLIVGRHADGTDWVKIVDFGIAKRHGPDVSRGESTTTGTTLGTPHYMSPEQARGEKKIDARADIYAVGVILYELLSGEKPHPGDSYNAIIYHILSKEPRPLQEHRAEIPRGLAEVVHRALSADPADRTPSASELEGALSPYAPRSHASLPSHVDASTIARTSPSSGATKNRGRRYAVAFGLGACLTGLAVWAIRPRTPLPAPAAEPSAPPAPLAAKALPSPEPRPAATAAPVPRPSATEAETPRPTAAALPPKHGKAPDKPAPTRAAPPAPSAAYDWSNPYQ